MNLLLTIILSNTMNSQTDEYFSKNFKYLSTGIQPTLQKVYKYTNYMVHEILIADSMNTV